MPDDIIGSIRHELERAAEVRNRETSQRFFREPVACYGVKTPVVRKIAGRYFPAVLGRGKGGIFALCDELFSTDTCEEAFIASEWAYRLRDTYESGDIAIFEAWIEKYVNNWAKCDTLCNHAVGALLERFPGCAKDLERWAASPNRWLRRAAAVSLVLPARKGMFLVHVLEISDRLLTDGDDLVQKGYGWLLKEAGRKHQKEVFDWVMLHRDVMPRTALRYAMEKMPRELRGQAMGRHHEKMVKRDEDTGRSRRKGRHLA
jgi:3-methyladenine DNA glycosylase AlkD